MQVCTRFGRLRLAAVVTAAGLLMAVAVSRWGNRDAAEPTTSGLVSPTAEEMKSLQGEWQAIEVRVGGNPPD